MLQGDFLKDAITINGELHKGMGQVLPHVEHGAIWRWALHAFVTLPFWLAVGGVALAFWFYVLQPSIPAAIANACCAR